jgi:hypothetical protein
MECPLSSLPYPGDFCLVISLSILEVKFVEVFLYVNDVWVLRQSGGLSSNTPP